MRLNRPPRSCFALLLLAVLLPVSLLSPSARAGESGEGDAPQAEEAQADNSVFTRKRPDPRERRALLLTLTLFRQGRYADAERVLRQAIDTFPDSPAHRYNLACALARQGKADAAMAALRRAVEAGYLDAEAIEEDDDLAGLRERDDFRRLVAAARAEAGRRKEALIASVEPSRPKKGVVRVTEANTVRGGGGVLRVFHDFPDEAPDMDATVRGKGEHLALLRAWRKDGTAAGLWGVLYDNFDKGHSRPKTSAFPELTRIVYGKGAKEAELVTGLQRHYIHNRPVVGNSSTAMTGGAFWRSQARFAMVGTQTMRIVYRQYVQNHAYFYPEHRDHDAGKKGDVFPANIPCLLISQGSSGSDRPFMDAWFAGLYALRPAVRAKLERHGILMPTMQYLFRRHSTLVETEDDYLTGKAHPTVFDKSAIDTVALVRAAQAIAPDAVPPMVQMRVTKESEVRPNVDFFDISSNERIFDTPVAIARVFRGVRRTRRYVLDASASRDVDGRAVTWRWRVLRGDPDRIRIVPLEEDGSRVGLEVAYHQPNRVQPGSSIRSSRIDIGCFVHNGEHYGAPGFFSVYFLADEKREYADDGRILSVRYGTGAYADPLVHTRRSWTDTYDYADDGTLLGWTRTREKAEPQRFTADGALVLATDDAGRPFRARTVRYVAEEGKGKRSAPHLVQAPGPVLLTYGYDGPDDRRGEVVEKERAPPPPAE